MEKHKILYKQGKEPTTRRTIQADLKKTRVGKRQEIYHRPGLEDSPPVVVTKKRKDKKKNRPLIDATNRPPFVTAVPVGRFVTNDRYEDLFVFQGEKRNNDTPHPKAVPKKRKSPCRPPFILSTRRPSIVSVDSIPRLITSSSLKKRNAKHQVFKKANKGNASIALELSRRINANQWIQSTAVQPPLATADSDLTFNIGSKSGVMTSTVQKEMPLAKPSATVVTERGNEVKDTTFDFFDGISPLESHTPEKCKEAPRMNETFTEENVEDFYNEPEELQEVETVKVKYPDSIARHKARASKRSRSMAMSVEVLVEAKQVEQRRKVQFSFCSPSVELPLDIAAQTSDAEASKKTLKRKKSVISIDSSPEIEEPEEPKVSVEKKLTRQKGISVEDSPEAEKVAKRSLFEGVPPVNKAIDKLKKRESKRRSRSMDNWSPLAVVTPQAEPQSVASLLTPTAGGDDDITPSKRRRTKQSVTVSTNKPKNANYYYSMLDDVTGNLKNMAQIWLDHKAEKGADLPDAAHEMIDSVTGQTNLLITKKFMQFRKLIALYDRNAGEKKVYSDDLDGFWSMIHMQVDDLYQRFAEVQLMTDNNWQEKTTDVKPAAKKRPKKKVRQQVATKSSGLLDFIRKTRMEKMKTESSAETEEAFVVVEAPPPPMTPTRQSRRLTLNFVTPRRRSDGCSGCTPSSKSAKKKSRRTQFE